MRDLLAKNHLRARKRFQDLQASFAGTASQHHAEQLAAQLEKLDFRAAERTLNELMSALPTRANS